jgi:hypothetical protein
MTIHEEVESDYMKGWHIGAMPAKIGAGLVEHYKPKGMWTDEMQRGYEAGRNCAEIAARVERERKDNICPRCLGAKVIRDNWDATAECYVCNGTGRMET